MRNGFFATTNLKLSIMQYGVCKTAHEELYTRNANIVTRVKNYDKPKSQNRIFAAVVLRFYCIKNRLLRFFFPKVPLLNG